MAANRNGKRLNFSSFTLNEALEKAGISEPKEWRLPELFKEPSPFHNERMARLSSFDTMLSEAAKLLRIAAHLEEVVVGHPRLKVFVATPLAGADAGGFADYLIAEKRMVPRTPLLCVVEAKKDDFEKGLAQILVEMTVCAELNANEGKMIDLYGVISNGTGWELLKRSVSGEFFRNDTYSSGSPAALLGALDYLLTQCDANLDSA